MNQGVPEPWATAMVRARFVDTRYDDDRPSLRRLADKAGLHTTTVSNMVHGLGVPKASNVAAVAKALRVDVVTVSGWVKQARTETKPYKTPEEINLLTRREQDAITELIRAMAERKGVTGNAAHPASTSEQDPRFRETTSERMPEIGTSRTPPDERGPEDRGA